ncbi:DDE-type integrase/transposase/recombinase [Sulfitobacter sp. R18_1]|uniref:integrase catalytic domain-containing protein n=1 Tax=Sulfitobacter sp. R18_1 TaxID=2821104 RepID=UPI001AD95F4B|nr:DDE-type integrase/transposase/recombinase [Sulfitobacter sp. R18_1]MBO9430026.1 transposase family protein [Sulfitobacter sp. R18_1]
MTAWPQYKIPVGSTLVLGDVRWCVTGKDQGKVFVESLESGEITQFSMVWLQKKIEDFSCKVKTPLEEAKREELLQYTGGFERLENIKSKEERLNIRARLSVILAIEELEKEGFKTTQRFLSTDGARARLMEDAKEFSGDRHIFNKAKIGSANSPWTLPKGRTLADWLATYRYFDRNEVVLMSRHHMKGPKGQARCKLSKPQLRFIQYVLSIWLRVRKPRLAPLYRKAMTKFKVSPQERAEGFVFPTLTSIYNWRHAISKLVETLAREGERHAVNLIGAGQTEIRAQAFGDEAETDQLLISLFINDDGMVRARKLSEAEENEEPAPNEIRRVWLHYMIDIATRMPLAWVLAESADSDTTMQLIRMATRSKEREKIKYGCKGTPAPPVRLRKVVSDNGTAVRNGKVAAALLGMGTVYKTTRTYHSNDKPYVESAFRTFEYQVVGFENGYTGGKPGALPGSDPRREATLTLDAFYRTITRYFIDEAPHQQHRGTGMYGATPAQKLREVRKKHREIKAPDVDNRQIQLGITKEFTINGQGVQPFGLPFSSTALRQFDGGKGKKVLVHIDPDRLHDALITAEGYSGEPIKAHLSMTAVRDCTLAEFLQLKQNAVEADPHLKEIDDQVLQDALARRAEASGMFPDSDEPLNYTRLAEMERCAERLARVECRPKETYAGAVRAGSIMDHARTASAARNNSEAPATASSAESAKHKTFGKITESKL